MTLRIHALAAAMLMLFVAGCDQKMNYNGKVRPLSETAFFKDQRAARPLSEHTVARGLLKEDAAFFQGKVGNDLVTSLPIALTRETLIRGRERFNIYCAPCHGRLGDGNGMIVSRGFTRPTSYSDDRLLTAPVGHFFDAMTKGFGRMPSYTLQVPPEDRWAIAAYVRALQLSQNAPVADLSEEDRGKLPAGGREEMNEVRDFMPPDFRSFRMKSLAVGVAGTVATCVGVAVSPHIAMDSYLLAWFFWGNIAIGCLAILMLQYLTGGAWGVMIRRIAEAGTRTLPLILALFLPSLLLLKHTYEWSHPEVMAADPLLRHKQAYLNPPFFIGRTLLYFTIWLLLSNLLNRWSVEQDSNGPRGLRRKLSRLSGAGMLLYIFTMTFAAIDWLMSVEPHSHSTMFGVIVICGQGMAAFSFIVLVAIVLSTRKPLAGLYSKFHFNDLGNLMLAFVMLFAYVSFSQFLITWSGNLPEEIPWYLRRHRLTGQLFTGALIVIHFAVPFVLLLSRDVKRNTRLLGAVAVLILCARLLDLFWVVMPPLRPERLFVAWTDITALVGLGGIWLAAFSWQLQRRPLLPANEPRLKEALESEGYGI